MMVQTDTVMQKSVSGAPTKKPLRGIFYKQLDLIRFSLVVLGLIIYALAIIPLYPILKETTFFISLLPLLLTASILGTWPALVVAALVNLFNIYLAYQFSQDWGQVIPSGSASALLHLLIGAGVGRWRDLHDRLKDEVLQRREVENDLEYLAYHDPLTGLPNRRLFADRLDVELVRSQREKQKLAIFFLNLDRFKDINDTLGHERGDRLLLETGRRIKRSLRAVDTVARFGSDTFVAMLPNVRNAEDISSIADKIFHALNQTFYLSGHEIHVTARIGVAISPGDGESKDDLLRNADAALSRAKEDQSQNLQLYNSQINRMAAERMALENGVRRALAHEEFITYYQPIIDVKTGVIVGMEALLRWYNAREGKMIMPDKFIPIAEDTGIITPLGDWVLRQACRQACVWRDLGFPGLVMAVNLSPRQLKEADLVSRFEAILAETGMDPQNLVLEITEGILMGRDEVTLNSLQAFRNLGIGLAVDDFGTGYSCLGNLKRLPITTLKIDRSFVMELVKDQEYAAITHAIIAIAKTLKLRVVAEGVETEEQRAFLYALHCDEMQGYLFSKPLPSEEITRVLLEMAERRHRNSPAPASGVMPGTRVSQ